MKRHIIINDTWPDGLPEIGEDYLKILPSGGTSMQAYVEPLVPVVKPAIEVTNIQIPAAELKGAIYWIRKDEPIVIAADCLLPDGKLMVMVERVIDGKTTVDDIRAKATILNGVMTMTFIFDTSGNYIFRESRINEGLDRIGAEFHLNFDDVEFDVFVEYP